MTSNLESRLQRIEALAPVGRNKLFTAYSTDEARARHKAMKAAGEITDADTVCWLVFGVAEPGEEEMGSAIRLWKIDQ